MGKDLGLLGCDAVLLGELFLTLEESWCLEDEGTTILNSQQHRCENLNFQIARNILSCGINLKCCTSKQSLMLNDSIIVYILMNLVVMTHIKLRRLEWAGHICRMDGSRTPRKILEGNYTVVDQQGSQRTWIDVVNRDDRQLLGTAGWKNWH